QSGPEEAAGPRVPRGGRKPAFPGPNGKRNSPESFYWHPCRKSASPVSADKGAMHSFRFGPTIYGSVFSWISIGTSPHADRAVSTRHSPKHRHHPAPLRLPGGISPYHRAGGISGIRPQLPPGRDGLSRPGCLDASRFLDEIRTMAQGSGSPPPAVHHQG